MIISIVNWDIILELNINAALACAQLEQLSVFLENKRSLANNYEMFFKEKGIKFRTETNGPKKLLANVY